MTATLSNEHVQHPTMRLGLRKPSNKPTIRMVELLTGVLPERPLVDDHFAKVDGWGLDTNDQFGVCGPTSVDNLYRIVTAYLTGAQVNQTLNAVYDLYRRSGNPRFNPETGEDDNGVDMKTMLAELVKNGIGGVRAVAFGSIDPRDPAQLWAGIAIFGAILLGVDLDVAQQDQTQTGTWTYKKSAPWGGHAIVAGQYADKDGTASDRTGVITWAQVVELAASFAEHQIAEAYVVVWPEHLTHQAFLAGVDLPKLAQAFKTLTGKTLNINPAPAPGPDPAPAADVTGKLEQLLRTFVADVKAGLAKIEQVLGDLVP